MCRGGVCTEAPKGLHLRVAIGWMVDVARVDGGAGCGQYKY